MVPLFIVAAQVAAKRLNNTCVEAKDGSLLCNILWYLHRAVLSVSQQASFHCSICYQPENLTVGIPASLSSELSQQEGILIS